jgi:hypothetical protein
MTTIQDKIDSLQFNATLKEITDKGFKWSVAIGNYETEYNVGNGHYFNVYGYNSHVANRNAVHYLTNGHGKISKDNIIALTGKLIGDFTISDLRITDKIKIIDRLKIQVTCPDIKDVLYSLYSEATLSLYYSLDEFTSEFMQGKKISETIECYKSCEKSLKWLIQSGFNMQELQEYFESIGY